MKKIIIYIQGDDRPGLISNISKSITNNKGNIETSKMIKLESIFNMILLVSIDNKNFPLLKKSLNTIENKFIDLFIRINTSSCNIVTTNKLYEFILKGADTEGLVHVFTDLLHEYKINIENMDTEINNAPVTGHPLFFLNSVIYIPDDTDIDELKTNLLQLADKHNVAIKLRKQS